MNHARKTTKPKDRSHDRELRGHILDLLSGEGAHAKFEEVVSGMPSQLRGAKPAGFLHSPWMLLEHMRIAQWDILEFCRNPNMFHRTGPPATGHRQKLHPAQQRGIKASSNSAET
jgi:hypothetical protein